MEETSKQVNVDDVKLGTLPLSNVRVADIKAKGWVSPGCQVGGFHPIRVEDHTKSAGPDAGIPVYLLVVGHEWLDAAIEAGFETLLAVVAPPSDRGRRILEQTAENLQREDLTNYEEAQAFFELGPFSSR